jgi:hypothetical protein
MCIEYVNEEAQKSRTVFCGFKICLKTFDEGAVIVVTGI